ncbi:LptF/LptG family permease [Candidatus Pelagibacter sp.]|nr:LptF/LptG family permease [Candidatus Pelagibacter sp.]
MKKLIFRKFAKDLAQFFLLLSVSITLIVWVIQAVNFLDIVTEDGHGLKIYFLYTLLSLPKIFSKVLPFIYFVSVFYIILKYENNNELIIFWTIGINKLNFVNILIKFSLFYLVLQLLFTTYIVPKTLDDARSFIRSSNVDLYGSIIQEKKFIDTVKNLTIFVEEKSTIGELKNIFLKEKIAENEYQIIFSKRGRIKNKNNQSILVLYDGKILNNNDSTTKDLKFSETELNLSKFSTKTTTTPKIQETSTYEILECIVSLKNFSNLKIWNSLKKKKKISNCSIEKIKDSFQEMFKRIILPFYLPVLSLIASLIIVRSKDDYKFLRHKFILFLFGVTVIIISELSLKYSSDEIRQNIALISIPIILFSLIYIYLISKFKISTKLGI